MGGSGQLGQVYVSGLVERGMRVASFDLSSGSVPEGARAYDVDITDRAAVERALDDVVRELGVPRLLVNNAGLDSPPDAPAAEPPRVAEPAPRSSEHVVIEAAESASGDAPRRRRRRRRSGSTAEASTAG